MANAVHTPGFRIQPCQHLCVQVPEAEVETLLGAITRVDPLVWGDYAAVSFVTAPGVQRFRSLGSGRNRATDGVVSVPCVELRFVVQDTALDAVLMAIHEVHPYEEPVVIVQPCLRTLHIRGHGDENPNRFWNRPDADWVPAPHRHAPGNPNRS